jgi:hypothetical protein
MDIRDVVRDEEWQDLRLSFIGTWRDQKEENVKKLEIYLQDGSDPLRVRRVLNYLTGTGFRSGTIAHPSIDELRERVRKLWSSL